MTDLIPLDYTLKGIYFKVIENLKYLKYYLEYNLDDNRFVFAFGTYIRLKPRELLIVVNKLLGL